MKGASPALSSPVGLGARAGILGLTLCSRVCLAFCTLIPAWLVVSQRQSTSELVKWRDVFPCILEVAERRHWMYAVPVCSTGCELSGLGISDPGHQRQERWHSPSFILCSMVTLTFSWEDVS